MKWYVVNVYSGAEQKVREQILELAERRGMSSMFGEILKPVENVMEVKKGVKVETTKQFFPGYILVQMDLTDESWHLVRAVPKVSGFLGARGNPQPVSAAEVKRIVEKVEDSANNFRNAICYEVGDTVTICDGPFTSFQGVVEEVDQEKERVKVSVSIFGRPTNVDLSFSQVEKVL